MPLSVEAVLMSMTIQHHRVILNCLIKNPVILQQNCSS